VPEAPLEATKQIDRRIGHILARAGRDGAVLTVRRAFLAGEQPIDGRHPSDTSPSSRIWNFEPRPSAVGTEELA
jgi:hypothetical protein